jgi:hypothetical protein
MAVICRTYTSHEDASRAVEALLGAGVPGTGIRVLAGAPEHDVRAEPEGEFAGTTGPGETVGDFAGPGHQRGDVEGTYAAETPDEQRVGSFADAERETVSGYPDGIEHTRVADHRDVRRLLLDAGLDEQTADRDAAAVRGGGVVVLAELGDRDATEVEAAIDR